MRESEAGRRIEQIERLGPPLSPRKKRAGDDYSLYIAVAVPAIVLIIWIMTFWFMFQTPIVDTTDIDSYFDELNSPPDLPLFEPVDSEGDVQP
jgi:hypothetical protein